LAKDASVITKKEKIMAEKKQSRSGINPDQFIKKNQLKKKRKEASEKPRKNLKKRTLATNTGRQGAGPFPFKKGGRS
jgi:hypothetical protein